MVGTRILTEETAGEAALWQAPSMEEASTDPMPHKAQRRAPAESSSAEEEAALLRPMTAEQLEAVQESARQEGFSQGREEGLAAAAEELGRKTGELTALLQGLARPLETADERVVEELVALAVAMSRHIVRRELQTAPDEIIRVVREALAVLPSQTADVRVEMHPQDAGLVRESLPESEGERAWRIVEDPALTRGGCRVISDVSRVDATVEQRLNQVIAAALGDMRGRDGV